MRGAVKTLKIDLSDIAGTPGARGLYSICEYLAPFERLSCVEPVRGEITVQNTGSLLLVTGRLRSVVEFTCTRCLEQFRQSVTLEVEETFSTEDTEPDIETMDRVEPDASAIGDYILDAGELARQQVLVNAPMAPVCRSDCAGICPRCGQQLNQGPCDCRPETAEDRWAKLRELLPEAPEQEQ